jgi:glycosyltransferase involved in cell wall biosynthesis
MRGSSSLSSAEPTITVLMLAQGFGETTLADRAFSSVPKEWKRILVLEGEPDAAWSMLVKKHQVQVEIVPFFNFAAAKNAGLDLVKTDWVFVLDSDEMLTPEIVDEIATATQETTWNAYYVPRQNTVLGKVVHYGGWYPDYQLRLFRPSIGRYVGEVHELIQTDVPIGYLKHDLQHDNIRSITQWHTKIDRYTSFEADILAQSCQRATVLYLIGTSVREFLKRYIRLKGYRDGMRGLMVAGMASYYRFLAGAKLWEKEYTDLYKQNEETMDVKKV